MSIRLLIEKSIRAIRFPFYRDIPIDKQIELYKLLGKDLTKLFWRMRLEDRSHSLEVMNRMKSITDNEEYLILALIHDIGKASTDIGLFGRIFADLTLNRSLNAKRYKNHETLGLEIIMKTIDDDTVYKNYKKNIIQKRHHYLERCDY